MGADFNTWFLAALAVLFAGLSATTVGLSAALLLPRWWERDIDLRSHHTLLATLVGFAGGAVVGLLTSAPVGAAFAAFAAAGFLAAVSDWRCRLIPSGAMWVATGLGLLALATSNVLAPDAGPQFGSLPVMVIVAGLFAALAFVTGGVGGGDLRLMAAAAATLWWVPALWLLGALVVAQVIGLVVLLVSGRQRTAMGPAMAGCLASVALVAAVFVV